MSAVVQSKLGPLRLTAQSDDAIRVTAGESQGYGKDDDPPIVVRGVALTLTTTLYRQESGEWNYRSTFDGGTYFYLRRAGTLGVEATTAMDRTVREVVQSHVATWAAENAPALAEAGERSRESRAQSRDEDIGKLRATIAALEAQAAALRAGGREVQVVHHLTSGGEEQCRQVITAEGELMAPVPELPSISGTSRWAHRGTGIRESILPGDARRRH